VKAKYFTAFFTFVIFIFENSVIHLAGRTQVLEDSGTEKNICIIERGSKEGWRKLHNHKLHYLYLSSDIVRIVK
jgi:hypothetical protein